MAIRTITWTVDEKLQISPKARQHAGVQGDNNATEVVFELPPLLQSGYVLYLEFIGTYGAYDKTEELEVQGGAVRFPLPKAWTQEGGDATIRLAAVQEREGAEVSGYTFAGRVCFEDRPAFGRVKSLLAGTIHKLLELAQGSAEVAQEQAAAAADDAARAEAASVSAKMDSQAAAASAGEAAAAEAAAETSSRAAAASAGEANGYSSHPPVIGADGNWMQWDGTEYVSTGHPSKGEKGDRGERGVQGEQGIQGEPGEITTDYANRTYANAIRGAVSGVGAVWLDEVSPIEHELDVRMTTEEPMRLTGEKLSVYGKNLCDYTQFKPYSGGTITLVENGFTFTGRYYCSLDGSFLPLGRYYMSWKFKSESSITPVWRLQYQDGTYSSQIQNGGGITITQPVKYVLLYHEMVGGTHTATYTDIQLEIGTSATQYEPYQRTEHTADANGIVKGVKSISPVTTLVADAGINITAEHNKDTAAVVNDLMERIVALEAAIVNN